MKTKKIFLLLIISLLSFSFFTTAYAYEDIKGNWAEIDIQTLDFQGLIYNNSTNFYRPDDVQTRAETAYFIYSLGINKIYDEQDFLDVKSNTALYKQIRHTVATGLMHSFPDETFRPDQPLTRNEAFVIAAYLLPLKNEVDTGFYFTDFDTVAAYAIHAVEMLLSYDALTGYPDNTIRGSSPITRSEFAHLFTAVLRCKSAFSENTSFSSNVSDWLSYPDLYRPYLANTDRATYGTGSVSGYVTRNTVPLSGATVIIQQEGDSFSVVTDYTGYYSVNDLPVGSYTVIASKSGYPTIYTSLTITDGGKRSLSIELSNSSVNTRHSELTGYVYDIDTYRPVSGATISVTINSVNYKTETNSSGYYQIELPVGNYSLTVTRDGYNNQTLSVPIEFYRPNSKDFYIRQIS